MFKAPHDLWVCSNNYILDFSWLPQVTKGFSKYCPIYWEANCGLCYFSTTLGLSVWSCLLFSTKPSNNWKTRSLGSHFTLYNLLIKLHPWYFLNISQVITASAQHVLFAVIWRLSSDWQIPDLHTQHLETTATTSHITQTTTLSNQDTFNVAFLQTPRY